MHGEVNKRKFVKCNLIKGFQNVIFMNNFCLTYNTHTQYIY